MRTLNEEYKALNLLGATARTASTTGSAVAVETYDDDAMAVVSIGGGGAGFTAPVYIVGAKTATPSTYDQVLATFSAQTAVGVATKQVNLAGIANVQAGLNPAGSTSITASIVLLAKSLVGSATLNS